jgi:hypothetical protein
MSVGAVRRFWRRAFIIWREMTAGGASYPVFRRELRHWDRGRRRRLDETFGLLALANVCLMPVTLLIFPSLLAVQAALDEALGLAITPAAASLVVAERDQRTWSVLRSTALSSSDILLGKAAGLLHVFWQGASYIALGRLLGTLLAVPLLGLMLAFPAGAPLMPGWPAVFTGVVLVLLYLAHVNRLMINLLFGGCLGLLASTLAASAQRAVAAALTWQLLLLLPAAGLVVWSTRELDLTRLFAASVLGEQLRLIFNWLIPLGVVALGRLLLAPVLFGLAVFRVERSPA